MLYYCRGKYCHTSLIIALCICLTRLHIHSHIYIFRGSIFDSLMSAWSHLHEGAVTLSVPWSSSIFVCQGLFALSLILICDMEYVYTW